MPEFKSLILNIPFNPEIMVDFAKAEVVVFVSEHFNETDADEIGLYEDQEFSRIKLSQVFENELENIMDESGNIHTYESEKSAYNLDELKKARDLLSMIIKKVEEL